MGGIESKSNSKLISKSLQPEVENSLKMLLSNVDLKNIEKHALEELFQKHTTREFTDSYTKYLFRINEILTFDKFKIFYYNLSANNNSDDKTALLIEILTCCNSDDSNAKNVIKQHFKHLVESYLFCLLSTNNNNIKQWKNCGAKTIVNTTFIEYFFKEIDSSQELDVNTVNRVMLQSLLGKMYDDVINCMFNVRNVDCRLPLVTIPGNRTLCTCLDMTDVLFLSDNLDKNLCKNWRLLFSSIIHGESWVQFLSNITAQGPTLIIITDNSDVVFGAFASRSWKTYTTWYGDEMCFLFHLRPKLELYPSTGRDNHFQYLNQRTSTLPNGLGMGGQFSYWGFFLEADNFGQVHVSKSCNTFSKFGSSTGENINFKLKHLEVWGIGTPDPTPEELGERCTKTTSGSTLDKNPEISTMLDMIGKGQVSKGIREVPEDSEN